MFQIGEKRRFSFGTLTFEKEYDVDFQYMDGPAFIKDRWGQVKPNEHIYRVVKIYLAKGRGESYIGISDKGHILLLPPNIALERIR